MNFKVIIFGLVFSLVAGTAAAQSIEQDDMYFNSKDRVKLREARKAEQMTFASAKKDNRSEEQDYVNPTDSYSARNVNPEFTSRSQSRTAKEDEENYFVNNYQYNNRSNYNNFNNNFNSWYGNSWYSGNYYGPSINSWNSPYYGYYDSWNSPWYDPYFANNGWSSSFSYYSGNSWNYGWGGSYNYWNRPACGTYFGYGSNYGYGGNWYWSSYRYPTTVVVVNSEGNGRGVSYGKRPNRGSAVVSENNTGTRSRTGTSVATDRGNSGGRVSTGARTEYYNRSWRNTGSTNTSTMDSRTNTQNNRSWSNPSNNNNSSWGERSTNSGYTPAPSRTDNSSFGNNSSGGTRSNSSSSGSGTNGRSRGRD